MVVKSTRTDWLALLKEEGSTPTKEVTPQLNTSVRSAEPLKVQKVQKAQTTHEALQKPGPFGRLTVDEALEEMTRPRSGPGIQARLYREGEITKENAIEWIACAIIYRREGEEAPFSGWRRHARVIEEALDRFCEGEGA